LLQGGNLPQTPVDFTNIFVRPPGDLLYYLAVIALSQAGFFMALGQRLRRRAERAPRRFVLATLGAVITWALLMVGAMFALLTEQPADAILPPLERVAQVATILLLAWAFLTADHDRWGRTPNLILLSLLLVVAVGYIMTGIGWLNIYARADFNLSGYGVAWTFIPAVLAVLGIMLTLIYFRLITDAPLKLVYFAVLLLGYAGTLLQTAQSNIAGDYAGAIRLAFVASLLLLPSLIYRMVINALEAEVPEQTRVTQATTPRIEMSPFQPHVVNTERESAQLMKALGLILENATLNTIPEQIVLAAMSVLKSDIGALLSVQAANYADITWGIDRVMERSITSLSLNLDDQPTLVNAIERLQQRPLYPDRNVDELHDLYSRLDIEPIGPTYFQPLVTENELLAVLVIGMPYAGRELSDSERELLKGIGIIASRLLALSKAALETHSEDAVLEALRREGAALGTLDSDRVLAVWHEVSAELEAARDQIMQLSSQVTQLTLELDEERSRVASSLDDTEESQTISQRIIALNDEQQRLIDERDRLAARLRESETALLGAVSTDNEAMFKSMIEVLRRDKDELVAQRDRLQSQLAEVRGGAPEMVQDMIDRMSQEKARLEAERDQLSGKLSDIELQLRALGINEGAAGITQLIGQLYEHRASLQTKNEALRYERDVLRNERTQFEEAIAREKERDKHLQALQEEVKHLAADREAATKQRDKFRTERDDMFARQEALRDHQARLLAEITGYEQELLEVREDEKLLKEQIQQLSEERRELASERDRLLARLKGIETERDQLIARAEGDRERLHQLGADGIGSLMEMVEDLTNQRSDLERQLSEAQNAVGAADDRLAALQKRAANQPPQVVYRPENPELILGMVQELRTPMTSIVGYVDLMLNESAGILGEMQRKFLQRVSANITRLASMLEDLTRITFLDAGQFSLAREPIDVIGLIEDAITGASNQLREKGLSIHLNLDDEVTPVRADRDAISQIVGQLLTNAYLASPPGSEIYVTARRQAAKNGKYPAGVMFVSIEDRGGGIAPEDQARVFARKYKAENPLIQGLGDTGVGLAIARALVEAHGGEIWLDTYPGIGSAFNFTLPLEVAAEAGR
jgi:signal transduction histidine kinase